MTRTSDLRFRKPSLYPAELRDRTLDALPCDARPFQRADAKRVWRLALMACGVAVAGAGLMPVSAGAASPVSPSLCIEGGKTALSPRLSAQGGEAGEFVLSDGSKVRISGLIWPQDRPGDRGQRGDQGRPGDQGQPGEAPPGGPGPTRTSEHALAARSFMERIEAMSRAGELMTAPGSGPVDRWGRAPVHVVMAGTLGAELALAAGLATLRPGDVSPPCRRALQAVEAGARDARLGLWASPDILCSMQPATPRSCRDEGRYTIVEGRVRGLGETSARAYLNFGTIRSENFSIAIPKGALRRFEASGMTWKSLEGRKVRVRGVVLDRAGPLIEISGPDEFERLD